jgi:hypothetical protein
MRPSDLLWMLLPDDALPLVVAVLALVVIVGLVRPRRAVGILVMVAMLPVIGVLVDSVLAVLPWWATALLMVWLVSNAVKVVLELFFGREAAGEILGRMVVGTAGLCFGLLLGLLRGMGGLAGAAFRQINNRHQG